MQKTYIQIGTNVGSDDFFDKMGKLKDRSIIHLIEPNSNLHNDIIDCYRELSNLHNVRIHPIGISNTTEVGILNLYRESGHSSLINRASHRCKTSELEINCVTLSDFCENNSISDIELLSIDAEGMDYEILKSIDLSKVSINEIIFEEWPYESDDQNGKFSTGYTFLEDQVLHKYNNYTLSRLIIDGQSSFQLIKNKQC